MAKSNETPKGKTEQAAVKNAIKAVLVNIRKFTFMQDRLFIMLKTSKKDMVQKEIAELSKLANEL